MPPPASVELRGGRYALVRKLGEGSQGETYEAIDHGTGGRAHEGAPHAAPLADRWARYVRDQQSGGAVPRSAKLVAIKCFRMGNAKSWKDVELAEREARTLSSLDHPRLPKYLEHFEEDGALYLVMEKIEGESLASLRAKGRTMSVAEVTRMLEDIAEALRYLHGRAPHVVHRDIKPGNVIQRPDGSYALVDFGAVRDRLKPGGGSTVVGTFGYMAPEQFQGRASPRSDVYGLGATAITMLTGVEPEELPHEGLGIDVAKALARTSTPRALVRALEAMLVPDPDRRVGSAAEAVALLHEKREAARERGPERRERPAEVPVALMNRKQRRARRKQERSARHDERRRRHAAARARRPPIALRLAGHVGLLVAWVAVWVTVGIAVPLVLTLLSVVFGERLRRAAAACVGAAQRSQRALGSGSRWLSGYREEVAEEGASPKVRVATGLEPEPELEPRQGASAEDADAWMEDQLEREAEHDTQRERMHDHARDHAKRKYWGR